jgi:hypothetical protein
MKNPCRELRQLLGVNQVEFARMLNRSFQSVRAYEKHPEDTPAEVIERIRSIAAEAGHADWAMFLLSDEWRVVNVLYPGETLISAPKAETTRHSEPKPSSASDAPSSGDLHSMLDDILESGDPDAIRAVVPNLELFHKWVKAKSAGKKLPSKKKRA